MRKLGLSLAVLLASTALARADGITLGIQECNPGCGAIVSQSFGNMGSATLATGDFSATITGTQDNPPGAGGIMLSGTTIAIRETTGATATVNVFVTGQGYTTPIGTPLFESSFTQNLITGTAMTMRSSVDSSNGLFGGVTLSTFSPPQIPDTSTNQTFVQTVMSPVTLAAPYSLTDTFTFSANGVSQQTTATINILSVPGPIVGAGLPGLLAAMGFGGWKWRRRRKTAAAA
jgi:hypothetical protein